MDSLIAFQKLVREICEKHNCLTQKQRDALGVALYLEDGETGFLAVVGFLLRTGEIDMYTKAELLQLVK